MSSERVSSKSPRSRSRKTIHAVVAAVFVLALMQSPRLARGGSDERPTIWSGGMALAWTADPQDIEKFAIRKAQPPYPPMAEKYKIEGTVTVQVKVSSNGNVTEAEFVRGPNVFRSVSLDTAKRWEFKAPGSDGLQGIIHFTFKLDR